MAKTGRPRKEIDQNHFENLCGLQCTKEDICDFFGVTDKTIDAWCKRTYKDSFSVVFKQKRGSICTRPKNANMAIWLGKQYLGQKDEPEQQTDSGVQIIDDL